MSTTKQQRKYNIKPEEIKEKPKVRPKEVKKPLGSFRVLVDGSNFLFKRHSTYEEADTAGREFVGNSGSTYMVVGGCN